MRVYLHRRYLKKFAKLTDKNKLQARARIILFTSDPSNKILNNHKLVGKYAGYQSIDVTGDLRAVFQLKEDDIAVFTNIGTHSQLYG